MSTAPNYQPHYTIDDYQLWEGDWELWNGIAVAMTPSPFGQHGYILAQLARGLGNAIDAAHCAASVVVEIDWIIANDTVVRPDLSIVCGAPPERHIELAPALVVEVLSAGTRERDLTFKKSLYQQQSVPWYLIADTAEETLQALRLDVNGEYQAIAHSETLDVDICEDCSLTVPIGRLFR